MELGRPLIYDHCKRSQSGDAEATKLLQRPFRNPGCIRHLIPVGHRNLAYRRKYLRLCYDETELPGEIRWIFLS